MPYWVTIVSSLAGNNQTNPHPLSDAAFLSDQKNTCHRHRFPHPPSRTRSDGNTASAPAGTPSRNGSASDGRNAPTFHLLSLRQGADSAEILCHSVNASHPVSCFSSCNLCIIRSADSEWNLWGLAVELGFVILEYLCHSILPMWRLHRLLPKILS